MSGWFFFFFEFLTPSTLVDNNFLNFISFLTKIFCVPDEPKRGFQVFFLNTKNNEGLPLDLACLEHLSVQSPIDLPRVKPLVTKHVPITQHFSIFSSFISL